MLLCHPCTTTNFIIRVRHAIDLRRPVYIRFEFLLSRFQCLRALHALGSVKMYKHVRALHALSLPKAARYALNIIIL